MVDDREIPLLRNPRFHCINFTDTTWAVFLDRCFLKIAEGMSDKILDDFKGLFFARVLLRRLASCG